MAHGTVHLVAGSTGAGKSTLAAALARSLPGAVFGIDDWMGRLYWPDAVAGEDPAWAMERIARCTAQMRAVIGQVLPLGVNAIVDAGLTTRADRAEFGDWAEAQGFPVVLHWLDVPAAERWRRVEARNAAGGGATGFAVTREMFDFVEAMWEPPTGDEMRRWSGRRHP